MITHVDCRICGESVYAYGDTYQKHLAEHDRRKQMSEEEQKAQEPVEHELKCWPQYFDAIVAGKKPFELRKDDRNFQVGDMLILRRWNPDTKEYTGGRIFCYVTYKLSECFGLEPGYCILGIRGRDGVG